MTKPDFYLLVKCFGVPEKQTKFYSDFFKYFDLNCDGVMNKFEFCERLNKLRDFSDFDVVLDRFFELVDPQKSGWINKANLKKFFLGNLRQT